MIDDNTAVVFLAPYIVCPAVPSRCRRTNQTEVDITGLSGAQQTAPS